MRGLKPVRKGISEGIASVARMNRVHIQGEIPGTNQLTTSVRNMQGAERVRRKLSSIFQRLIAGIFIFLLSSLGKSPCPKIHGISCQSPRAQRLWRRAEAS